MDKSSELDCYLFYMWNAWSYADCVRLFGETFSDHIWEKWVRECERSGGKGAPASFYAELDKERRKRIVERAVKYYNK